MPLGCEKQDADLLMYVHGELDTLKQFAMALHLKRCPQCRGRAEEFQRASVLLAQAHGAAFGPASAPSPRFHRGHLAVLVAAMLLTSALASYWAVHRDTDDEVIMHPTVSSQSGSMRPAAQPVVAAEAVVCD